MRFQNIVKILSAGVIAFVMAGCGGGGSDGGGVSPTPPSGPAVVDSGSVVPVEFAPYQIKGNTFYYQVDNCILSTNEKVNFTVYADNTMQVESDGVSDTCVVTKKFFPHTASDGPINANYVDIGYFYDSSSGLFYTIKTHRNDGATGRLTKVINNGQNVINMFKSGNKEYPFQKPLLTVVEEVSLDY